MPNAPQMSNPSPLGPYRVLDLTEGGFNWCGKVLADLGADVIKIEPPGGSVTRRRGPFAGGVEDVEGSLFWSACCLNKRSAVLDLDRADGAEALRELARGADVLVESFTPGYLKERGLGFDDLAARQPRAGLYVDHALRADRPAVASQGRRHRRLGDGRDAVSLRR